MASYLRQATSSLLASLKAAGGESITYHYGELEIPMTAVKGESEFSTETISGHWEQHRTVDWIISAADLVVGGEEVEPQKHDLIEHGDDVFEVMPVGNLRPWDYSDPYKTMVRIHTRLREVNKELF